MSMCCWAWSLTAQNTFTSVQAGDWDDESTWFSGGGAGGTEGVDYPGPYDEVYVNHDVDITATNSGSDFIFEGYLLISAGNKLQCEIGSSSNGFALQGDGEMHVFGAFYTAVAGQGPGTGSPTDREFTVGGDSYFIAYEGSDVYVSDDWEIEDNCTIYVEQNVCIRVHDDVNFDGTGWYMCGDGDISIGGDGTSSNVSFGGGSSAAQICATSNVYRNTSGVTCTGTDLTAGSASTGPPPFAYDDFFSANRNADEDFDVLHQGEDDRSIVIGDTLTLTSCGDNGAADNNATTQGGTLSINNNGTTDDLTDDYIVYTPPTNFSGTDDFNYIVTNEDGQTAEATVTIFVACDGGQFTEAASTLGLDLGGNKDGGLSWYDFNQDDLLDVIVNTDDGTNDTRIYFQQTDGTFTDVTSTHAAALLSNNNERSVMCADLNNDGYVEFVRNTHNRVEVWQNNGPSASPAYSFSLVETYTSNSEGINIEGMGILDWDQDGLLDLIMDTDDSEIVLYENDGDGTFTEQTSGTGLPTGNNGVGDFATSLDWNNDGYGDFAARKSDGGTGDFWEFDPGTGQFSEVGTPNLATAGGEKGAITFCDLDQDGDFDFIWAHQSDDNDVSVYLQGDNGTFTFGTDLVNDGGIEECDCADIDNDGDNDIFLGDDGGNSYLYKNNTPVGGGLSFSQDNDCIAPGADVEGSEFVDFDNDGDMDLYMNINGGSNQLWVNAQNDDNYLIVEPRWLISGSTWRPATGANVMLISCDDTNMIKSVTGSRGHGSQSPAKLHFGLGGSDLFGPDEEYTVGVFFLDDGGGPDTVYRTITPSSLTDHTLIVYNTDVSDSICVGTDSDGDGTPDSSDQDDDNDGVLDINECLGELVVTTETGFFTAANLAFTIDGNVSDRTDPQVLQAIAVLGTNYNEFILPDSLDINYTSGGFDDTDARFLDAGVSQSQLSADGEATYETTGLLAFQDDDLNHYQMLDTPVDSTADYYDVYYDTPILSNGKVYVAFSERGGNNRFAFEAFAPDGTPYNQRVELALADYIDSSYPVAALGGGGSQNAEIAVLPVTDLAPLGQTIGRIRTIPFTSGSDAGDGKIFIFGSLTTLSGDCDSDGDGITNGMDLDSDNDGIPDIVESGGVDTDGDGYADDQTDSDGDGIVDQFDPDNGGTALPNIDSDNDGVYDKNDLDADDDGIADVNEAGGTDENGDGRADDYTDSDGDGYGDVLDGDVGNDGTAENSSNSLLLTGIDTDNDSRPNSFPAGDFDEDNVLNHIDIDSDNDGITDVMEVSGVDADSNGRYDNYIDNDNDGFNDLVDGDSTNALGFGNDANGNNTANALIVTGADANLDGTPDSYPNGDSDGDGNQDHTDIDSDNDGITDNSEGIDTDGYVAPSGTDTDGDGLDDSYDPDDAGTYVYPEDTDGDGTADYLDTDADDDGMPDIIEGHDSDGDAVADGSSPANTGVSGGTTDTDGDGLYDGWDNNTSSVDPTNSSINPGSHPDVNNPGNDRDWREIRDWDQDGVADFEDHDDDNDGVLDVDEAGSNQPDGDEDGDGIPNWIDTSDDGAGDGSATDYTDGNGDGIPDVYDFDEDGIPNHLDLDSDNDGITDLAENPGGTGTDADGDGVVDGSADNDGDGILDSADSNDASAGSPGSTIEDTDGDGNPDSQDLDSDNDGITDLAENLDGTGTDANNDGLVDGTADADNDGILDSADSDDVNAGSPGSEPTDTDDDGFPNHLDIDSDNDGITDLEENPDGTGTDSNNDGIVDGSSDTDGDGILNSADSDDANAGSPGTSPTDTDGDGLPNPFDIDADDDGIIDNIEAQATIGSPTQAGGSDGDNDGLDNNFETTGLSPVDTDADGTPDYLDNDSDGDGLPDLLEGWDTDGDYIADTDPAGSDSDGDGLDDNFDDVVGPNQTTNPSNGGQDANDFPDVTTADNTAELDWREANDTDGDGVADFTDLDDDNDGIPDTDESGGNEPDGDEDGDNIPNWLDTSDGGNGGDGSTTDYTDSNGDGIADVYDFDRDGIPNHLDKDSDNDGIVDILEAGGTDANQDGEVDYPTPGDPATMTDADSDGLADSLDDVDSGSGGGEVTSGTPHAAPNTDGAAGVNYLDIDADDDGIIDNIEAQTSTGSPLQGNGTDTDQDGIADAFDPDNGGTYITPVNTDGTGNPDYTDTDSDDDGESDLIEGWDTDGDGIADTSPASSDSDGDGLDDNFDAVVGPNATTNPSNNGQDAFDFPDADGGTTELDWRETPCEGGAVVLTPNNATTTANSFCNNDPWTYYYNPSDPTELLFAVERFPGGGNTNDFTLNVSLTVSSDPETQAGVYSATDAGNEQATFVMGRYYNISIASGSLNGAVNIRYFYNPDEADTLEAVAERWNDNNAGSTAFVSGRRWFAMNSGTFDPGSADLQATGIQSSTELFPASTGTTDGIDYVQFDGLTTLTGGGMAYSIGTNSVILPVELLDFSAVPRNTNVWTSWTTATELNSDRFEVERSQDGQHWEHIGTVKAAGTSAKSIDYEWVDLRPYSGTSYYRLRQFDRDNSEQLSALETVNFNGGSLERGLRVYPNPNDGSFLIELPEINGEATLILYNATGEILQRWGLQDVASGRVPVRGLAAGAYLIQLTTAQSSVGLRVIVQ